MSPLLASLGSYYTPTDGNRHAIVATFDGEVHELFYNPQTGVGNVTLASFCNLRCLTAFYTADDQTQHPVVATASGDIFEVYYKAGSYHVSAAVANFANIVGIAGFYAGDDHNRIVVVGTADGAIHEVFWNAAIGSHVTQPALATFRGLTHVAAYYSDDDKIRHAIVATDDGNVQEVWYSPKVGTHLTRPPLGNFPGIVSIAAFYVPSDKTSIVLVAQADGAITEIFFNSAIGVHQTRPAVAVLPGTVAISAFYTPDDKMRHVIAVDGGGKVTEIFYSQAHGISVAHPPLATFAAPRPVVEYIGPDIVNLDAASLPGIVGSSPAGRCVALAGTRARLHVFSDSGGIWSSSNGGTWTLEPSSPAPSPFSASTVTVMAVSPLDSSRVVACNPQGLWETTNGGATWAKLLDPSTLGLSSSVASVGFDAAGRVFAGVSDGVAIQQAAGQAFAVAGLKTSILAIAVSQTKVWARSQTALFVSTDAGVHWSAPSTPPATLILAAKEHVQLAATDAFAFMLATVPGTYPGNPDGCGGNNALVIFNAATSGWSAQIVTSTEKYNWQKANNVPVPESATCQGTGGDDSINGRQFVKCVHLGDTTLPDVVGQRIQLLFGAGQEVWRAIAQNNDGTVTDWDWAVGTSGRGFSNRDPVHADIWDFHLDVTPGGRTAWVACDGGVYQATVSSANYSFVGATWKPFIAGLHTHQIHSLTVLCTDFVSRPRIAYVIQDNSAFFQESTALSQPEAPWQSFGNLGDGNFSAGDSSAPTFAWLARQLDTEYLLKFSSPPQYLFAQLLNTNASIDPSIPTRFRFLPSPRQLGQFGHADVVMMTALPLIDSAGSPFQTQPGASSNGKPVLIRNRTFEANSNINGVGAQGQGWSLERASLPDNCTGFAVSGNRTTPVYFPFDASSVYVEKNGAWAAAISNIVDSQIFGPVFPNPYHSSVIYVLTRDRGVQVSRDGGASFASDQGLNTLLPSGVGDINQISFNYENPAEVVVGTESGHLLFSRTPGTWMDLTALLLRPLVPIRSVAIDCRALYLGTFGRGLWRIRHYGA